MNDSLSDRQITLAFGDSKHATHWVNCTMNLRDALNEITACKYSYSKDGRAFLQGALASNGRRVAANMKTIEMVAYDVENGQRPEEIETAAQKMAIACAIYATFNCGSGETTIPERELIVPGALTLDTDVIRERAVRYLCERRCFEQWLLDGAKIERRNFKYLVRHKPLPRFRVLVPLAKPIILAELGPTLEIAKQRWRRMYTAIAQLLGIHHQDASCEDPSRLFYTHRRSPGAETWVIRVDGALIDPTNQIAAAKSATQKVNGKWNGARQTNQGFTQWFRRHGDQFRAADFISAYGNGTRSKGNGHVEAACPNECAHSDGGDGRRTLYAFNAGTSENGHPVIGCNHDGCGNLKLTDFVEMILAQGGRGVDTLNEFTETQNRRERAREGSKRDQQRHNRSGCGMNGFPSTSEAPAGSDEALALQFAERYSDEFRYTAAWGRWHHYNEKFWEEDRTLLAYNNARAICRETAQHLDGAKEKKEATSAKKRAALMSLAREDRRLVATPEQWDRDPWMLNTPGGVVDLRTQEMRPQRPADYLTKATSVAPAGDCPGWIEFLKEITGGDEALQQFLKRVAGYSLTGDTREEVVFFAHGGGANGKSTFLRAITGILADYHRAAPIATFTERSNFEQHPTDLAMLKGARLVTSNETQQGRRWDESRIKALTGGDPISARFMRQDFFEYMPHFKLFIAGNHKPRLRSVDVAIKRRFRLLPFTVTIPEGKRDPDLKNKLRVEWSGILQWMMDGCSDWQEKGLTPPEAVMQATSDYLDAEDTLTDWIEQCCHRDPNISDTIQRLFGSWAEWAEKAGERVGTKRELGDRLEEAGFKRRRTDKAREIVGLKVLK